VSCVLRLVSAQGNPLPTCTCPSQHKVRAIARAEISWANGNLIFSFSDG
jgi:hypothetical protein